MITKHVIDLNGVVVSRPLADGERLTLQDKQQVVGGLIQFVPAFETFEGRPAVVYADEEGLLKRKGVNWRATQAWRQYLDSTGQPYDPDYATLVGDVLILTTDKDGEDGQLELDEA